MRSSAARSAAADYLRHLEALGARSRKEDLYLWPATQPSGDMGDLQEEVIDTARASDRDVSCRRSRPALIIRQIRALIQRGLVGSDLSICDIACGDALVLWQLKKAFPQAYCAGIDCNRGAYGTHQMAQRDGVELFSGYIQHLFANDPPVPFDLTLMLNTYRGWEYADLREHERDLPRLVDAWFARNARYAIVTATNPQIRRLALTGFAVARLGPGEEASTLVCVSTSTLPQSLPQRLRALGQTLGAGSRYAYLTRKAYRQGGPILVVRAALTGTWRKLGARYGRPTLRGR